MKKAEMIREYYRLLEQKNMSKFYGINGSSNKEQLQQAIDCLKCSDEKMNEYLIVFKGEYPNIYKEIMRSDFLTHFHNRYYVYDTARRILV